MDASTQSTETTESFTAAAWDRIAPIMAEIEALPLLQRLSDGTLPPEVFRHYILQDATLPEALCAMPRHRRGQGARQCAGPALPRFGAEGDHRRAGPACRLPHPVRHLVRGCDVSRAFAGLLCLYEFPARHRLSQLLRGRAFGDPAVLLDLLACRRSDQEPAGRSRAMPSRPGSTPMAIRNLQPAPAR